MKNPTKEEVRLAKVLFYAYCPGQFHRGVWEHTGRSIRAPYIRQARAAIRWVARNGWTRKP